MYVLLRLPMSRGISPAAAGSFPPPVCIYIYIYVFFIPAESGLLLGPGWRLAAHARPWRILGARRNQNKLEARRRPSLAWPGLAAALNPPTSPRFFIAVLHAFSGPKKNKVFSIVSEAKCKLEEQRLIFSLGSLQSSDISKNILWILLENLFKDKDQFFSSKIFFPPRTINYYN